MPIIAAGIIIAALLGGGVSIAAQSALPGDALYGVKVNVNENMQSAFAFSEQAKAQDNITDAKNRIKEAQQLSAEGKLSAQDQADLMANFSEHAQNASQEIADLQAKGNTQDAATLTAQFNDAVSSNASDTNSSSAPFMAQVQSELSSFNLSANGAAPESGSANTGTNTQGSTTGSTNTNGNASVSGSASVNTSGNTGGASVNGNVTGGIQY